MIIGLGYHHALLPAVTQQQQINHVSTGASNFTRAPSSEERLDMGTGGEMM